MTRTCNGPGCRRRLPVAAAPQRRYCGRVCQQRAYSVRKDGPRPPAYAVTRIAGRMSPRLDQLLVGTPVWVWMNNVSRSCLPDASPPPNPDCDKSQAHLFEYWPTNQAVEAGSVWRAAFPEKVTIELTPTGGGATSTYECWTDQTLHGVAGEHAPGRRPTSDAGSMPLATPNGPLNPGAGDCTFVADHPPVDCKDAVEEGHPDGVCRLIGEWDRPPQTVYLLPHWARYIRAVQEVTGMPKRQAKNKRGQPFLSAGFVVALIIHEHAALVAR